MGGGTDTTTDKTDKPGKPNKPDYQRKPKDPIQESRDKTKTITKTSGVGALRGTHNQDIETKNKTKTTTRARKKVNNSIQKPKLVTPEKVQNPKENLKTKPKNKIIPQNTSNKGDMSTLTIKTNKPNKQYKPNKPKKQTKTNRKSKQNKQ